MKSCDLLRCNFASLSCTAKFFFFLEIRGFSCSTLQTGHTWVFFLILLSRTFLRFFALSPSIAWSDLGLNLLRGLLVEILWHWVNTQQNLCTFRGAHICRWENKVNLLSSTWLLLNFLISMEPVAVNFLSSSTLHVWFTTVIKTVNELNVQRRILANYQGPPLACRPHFENRGFGLTFSLYAKFVGC